ncbi:MAG TPA: glycine--tRNA ligase subunit beta, partial [Parvularculaceae bacterium]|nr:glycine--tRNA ligase subunit beta [Parvularculaceae bacterium]
MPELLLEFLSEEIPARMQARAASDLSRLVNDRLLAAGFMPEGVKAFAGPRRLALVAAGLPARQPDRREEKKGPRVGAPDKAVEGFLKSAGLSSLDQCEIREDKKGAYYVAMIDEKGRDTAAVIADFMPEIAKSFPWPKSMRWGHGDLRWVRPLHSVLCCFNHEIVDFEIDGVRTSDKTQGHRFLAPKEIRARDFDKYSSALRRAKVILDADERKSLIAGEAKTLCEAQGLELVEDPALLDEVAGLAEWPVPMIGSFDEKFLALPDEVLTASMRGHQKYFSVKDPRTGRLANKFVFVANIETRDAGAAMRKGYERVLTARLSDAWYLYHQDLKTPLKDRVKDLDRVVFFEGLGTMGDKARRTAALAKEIAPAVGADPGAAEEAALLAKADLVTQMVYEFPELQGVMGRYYALEQGPPALHEGALDSAPPFNGVMGIAKGVDPKSARSDPRKIQALHAIADAIRDHYKPAGQDDDVPTAPVSVAVALADKIDTLSAFYVIDKKPTGAGDPFALRRAALGVTALILKNGKRMRLEPIFNRQIEKLGQALPHGRSKSIAVFEVVTFVVDRLKVFLKENGHRYDYIDANTPVQKLNDIDDFVLIVRKLEALEAFLKTDDGANLVVAYKRAANILKAEEKKEEVGRAS